MKIHHIAIMSENNVIAADGEQPFFYREDLMRFKEITQNHGIIMGRKSYEALPGMLGGRDLIVLTRQDNYGGDLPPSIHTAGSIDEALSTAKDLKFNDVYIAGGGEVYAQTMDMTHELRLTIVHDDIEGDTFYPEVDRNTWDIVYQKPGEEFSFIDFARIQE